MQQQSGNSKRRWRSHSKSEPSYHTLDQIHIDHDILQHLEPMHQYDVGWAADVEMEPLSAHAITYIYI